MPKQKSRSGKTKTTALVPRQRRLSVAVRKAWARAAEVDDRAIENYRPRKFDYQIAEALLSGAVSGPEIAMHLGLAEPDAVWAALREPVRAAWISRQLTHHFQHRLAFVDAALFKKAIAGNVNAIKLYLQRHAFLGKESSGQQHQHVHFHETRGLSNDDLDKIIREKARRLNILYDGDERPEDPVAEGAGGEGAEDGAGAVIDVSPAPETGPVPQVLEEAEVVSGGEPLGEDARGEA